MLCFSRHSRVLLIFWYLQIFIFLRRLSVFVFGLVQTNLTLPDQLVCKLVFLVFVAYSFLFNRLFCIFYIRRLAIWRWLKWFFSNFLNSTVRKRLFGRFVLHLIESVGFYWSDDGFCDWSCSGLGSRLRFQLRSLIVWSFLNLLLYLLFLLLDDFRLCFFFFNLFNGQRIFLCLSNFWCTLFNLIFFYWWIIRLLVLLLRWLFYFRFLFSDCIFIRSHYNSFKFFLNYFWRLWSFLNSGLLKIIRFDFSIGII